MGWRDYLSDVWRALKGQASPEMQPVIVSVSSPVPIGPTVRYVLQGGSGDGQTGECEADAETVLCRGVCYYRLNAVHRGRWVFIVQGGDIPPQCGRWWAPPYSPAAQPMDLETIRHS